MRMVTQAVQSNENPPKTLSTGIVIYLWELPIYIRSHKLFVWLLNRQIH